MILTKSLLKKIENKIRIENNELIDCEIMLESFRLLQSYSLLKNTKGILYVRTIYNENTIKIYERDFQLIKEKLIELNAQLIVINIIVIEENNKHKILKLMKEYEEKKIILELYKIKFENNYTLGKIYKIQLKECYGNLIINGNNNSNNLKEKFNININGIEIINSNFTNFEIKNSGIENFKICKNSIGNYKINNNKIKNINVNEAVKNYFLKNVSIFPSILLLSYFLINLNIPIQFFVFTIFPLYFFCQSVTQKFLYTIILMSEVIFIGLLDYVYSGHLLNIPTKELIMNVLFDKTFIIVISLIIVCLIPRDFRKYLSLLNIKVKKINYIIIKVIERFILFFIAFYIWENKTIPEGKTFSYLKEIENTNIKVLLFFIIITNIILALNLLMKNRSIFALINIEENNIETLTIVNSIGILKYILAGKGNLINIKVNEKIKNFILVKYEGSNLEEKIYLLLDSSNINIETFKNIDSLNNEQDRKYFDQFLLMKNKINELNNIELSIYKIFANCFHIILNQYFPIFLRPKNLIISIFSYFLIGLFIFNENNITIADTTTQVYLKNLKETKNINEHENIFYNEKNKDKTKIIRPDFYPEYSSITFTISLLIPIIEIESSKLYRGNNIFTDIYVLLYKIIALINSFALLFLLGRNFLPMESLKVKEK